MLRILQKMPIAGLSSRSFAALIGIPQNRRQLATEEVPHETPPILLGLIIVLSLRLVAPATSGATVNVTCFGGVHVLDDEHNVMTRNTGRNELCAPWLSAF